jgi:pyruvate/2-oxoglutarate dehydrogenase complex dihydrolipoamide acyltransferase (E2) component
MPTHRVSYRRRVAVASWRASRDGRIYQRMEIDASPMLAYAAKLCAVSGVAVTPTHVVGRAVALGLLKVPEFHTRVVWGRVRPHTRVDVGFAVDIDSGRDLAPVVIRGADHVTTQDIARRLSVGAAASRAGKDQNFQRTNRWVRFLPRLLLRPAMTIAGLWNGGLGRRGFGQPGFPLGNAFISSVGSLGVDEAFLAPLPLARVSLYICVGAVRDRPVAVDGLVVVRPTIVLTATADHRLVDGAHAAKLGLFLRRMLSDPSALDLPICVADGSEEEHRAITRSGDA